MKDTGEQPQHGSGRQPGNDEPYASFSSASPLMKMIEPEHYGVQLAPREKKTIRLWIDVSAQYPGTYAAFGNCRDTSLPKFHWTHGAICSPGRGP